MEEASKRVFDALGLDPKKTINLNELITVSRSDVSEPLFKTLLRSLILLDYTSRDSVIDNFNKSVTEPSASVSTVQAFFSNPVRTDRLNPMDALLACFHCSDLVLKQVIMEKLFLCKLAMPLIYTFQGNKERTHIFNLWAMRSIVATWQEEGRAVESTLVDYPLQMVTFMRLGVTNLSKSKLINEIIINGIHDTFFHRDCPQGVNKRVLSEEVVEAAFLLPNTAHPCISHPSLLCNLRGDASNVPNLVNALLECSCKVFIFVSMEWISYEENRNRLVSNIAAHKSKIHLMITATPADRKNPDYDGYGCLMSIIGGLPIDILCDDILNKAQMKDLFLEILKKLKQNHKPIIVEEIAERFGSACDNTDQSENGGVLLDCKKAAMNFLDHDRFSNVVESDCKDSFLPMQGETLNEIVSIIRESSKVRGKSRTPETVEMDSTKIAVQRRKQLNFFTNYTDTPFSRFLRRLQMFPEEGNIPFALQIKWYRLQFAKYTREMCLIPRQDYNVQLSALKEAKEKKHETQIKQITARIAKLDHVLKNSCFSLEHVFRELGQMYEALAASHDRNPVPGMNKQTLVDIGTRLLLDGNPIEIINGDSIHLHCPLEWIEAILKNVRSKCGDSKVFVLSTIGIQSSGKSTLLNAMFGVQFAVSAGRCTRGIYMQLLKVAHPLPFDFVLVVDTEGLRDDTLLVSQVRHNHDNELATMAIGIGDVTLVNVKGENNGEINDVLQIAVQAFLRMKSVNPKIKLHQKCIFIHQNVGGADAKEKLVNDRITLQESLDTITQHAAVQEGFLDITHFSDIIEFDYQSDVWYFPNLWFGNPPMAPVNSQYIETVHDLKQNILYGDCIRTKRDILTLAEVETRIHDLWTAILSDDFVYSFRNSLELQCYSDLEVEFNRICWKFDNGLNSFVSAAENKMAGAENKESLKKEYDQLISKADMQVPVLRGSAENELKNVFDMHGHKAIIAQWRATTMKKFEDIAERKIYKTKNYLSCAMKDAELSLCDLYKRGELEAELRRLAKNLAEKNKQIDKPVDNKTKQVFDKEMQDLLENIKKELPPDPTDVAKDVDMAFWETIPASAKTSVTNTLEKDVALAKGSLADSVIQDLVIKIDYTIPKSFTAVINCITQKNMEELIRGVIKDIFKKIDFCIDGLVKSNTRFKSAHAERVYQLMVNCVYETGKEHEKEFKLTPKCLAKIYGLVFRYSKCRFLEMQSRYVEIYGIMKRLEEYKGTAWIIFKAHLKNAQEEEVAGDMFCERIRGLAKDFVHKKVYTNLETVVCQMFSSKFRLITDVLEDLAQNDIFDDYTRYINDPRTYCFRWMEKFVINGLFGEFNANGSQVMKQSWHAMSHCCSGSKKKNFGSYAKVLLGELLQKIDVAIVEISEKNCKGIDAFVENISSALQAILPITAIEFDQVKEYRNIADISNLCRSVKSKLEQMKSDLHSRLEKTTPSSWMWGGDKNTWQETLDDLWGCESVCPHCGETCQYSKTHELHHSCIQHIPSGLTRWRDYNDKKLVAYNCSFAISSNSYSFSCIPYKDRCVNCTPPGDKIVWHKYSDYMKYSPKWKIDPCPKNDNFKYWQWVMARYNDKFATEYGCKPADIPDSWTRITQKEAIKSLREMYRLTN